MTNLAYLNSKLVSKNITKDNNLVKQLIGISSKKENDVMIYSSSCCSKTVWVSFFC